MHSMFNGKADINDDVDSGLIHKENYEAVNNELNELVYSFLSFLIMIGKRKESDEGHWSRQGILHACWSQDCCQQVECDNVWGTNLCLAWS